MLNPIARALAAFFRPIGTARSAKSDADRDANGRDTSGQNPEDSSQQEKANPDHASSKEQPLQSFSPSRENTKPELESKNSGITDSQSWLGLVTDIKNQEEAQRVAGAHTATIKSLRTNTYEKTGTDTSQTTRSKKGIIVDKKAA